MSNNINKLSEQLLLSVKTNKPDETLIEKLGILKLENLKRLLDNDDTKKAFWINIYNSFFLILRKFQKVEKSEIYTKKLIRIAGKQFSLDDIEHGIIRKYRYKFSLGYLPNLFANSLVKILAVEKIDYRIHFALNCGAESCPPIAFYTVKNIEQQLELATLSFLESETDVLQSKKEIHISKLFKWYHGDFGGNQGIRNILKEKLNLDTHGFKLRYKAYSWEEHLDNYSEGTFEVVE